MLAVDLKVGDIVTKVGEDYRYIVTSTRPVRGLPQYVSIMGPYGHSDDIWVNFIDKKVGYIDINYIFKILGMNEEDFEYVMNKDIGAMSDKEFQDAFIEGLGDLTADEFERLVNYISEKLGVDKEELLK